MILTRKLTPIPGRQTTFHMRHQGSKACKMCVINLMNARRNWFKEKGMLWTSESRD